MDIRRPGVGGIEHLNVRLEKTRQIPLLLDSADPLGLGLAEGNHHGGPSLLRLLPATMMHAGQPVESRQWGSFPLAAVGHRPHRHLIRVGGPEEVKETIKSHLSPRG